MPTNVYSHIDLACSQGRKRDNITKLRSDTPRRIERGFKPSSATARPPASMAEIIRFATMMGVIN